MTPEPKKPLQELQRQGTCVDSVQIRSPRLPFANEMLAARHLLKEEHRSESDCFQLRMQFSFMPGDRAASATE
jgi:hypothetical protein